MNHSPRNFVKAKTLYYLSLHDGERLTAREMADGVGASIHSLGVLLLRWRRWKYIKWWVSGEGFFRRYQYSLLSGGRCYVHKMPNWYKYWNLAKQEVDERIAQSKKLKGAIGFYSRLDNKYHVLYPPFETVEQHRVFDSEPALIEYGARYVRGSGCALKVLEELGVNPSPSIIELVSSL